MKATLRPSRSRLGMTSVAFFWAFLQGSEELRAVRVLLAALHFGVFGAELACPDMLKDRRPLGFETEVVRSRYAVVSSN